jgi:1,4-dihydroxy-2-naphthoate octaprenyltransferase
MINLVRVSRPLYLLLAALAYLLGAGLADYLGNPHAAAPFWLGLASILLALVAMFLLSEVFRPFADPILPDETLAKRRSLRDQMLYVSVIALGLLLVAIFVIHNGGHLSPSAILYYFILLGLSLVYGVPPFRLVNRGFGEVILAVQLAYVIPSLAFLLQAGAYHRLLAMVVFPLMALALAAMIVLDFPRYARDRKYNRGTLLVRLGWERAVPFHNILILAAYLILLAAPIFGISLALVWPGFLTLPFAILQIFSLRSIALGGKPIWTLLTVTAIAVFGLTTYFLTLTFWLR